MSAQEVILVGTLPNDGTGDPLRVAFQKINNNFSNLFATTITTSNAYSIGNTAGQVIFETPANSFSQGIFNIRSNDPGTVDSQNITLKASINNANTNVKWTGYATTFDGTPITSYDMDIAGGNVRILVNPLRDAVLFHFISSEVTFVGIPEPGLLIQLDGYAPNNVMSTENDVDIATENA